MVAQLVALKVQPNVHNVKFYQPDREDASKKGRTPKVTYSSYVSKKGTHRWKYLQSYLLHRDCVTDVACCSWDGSVVATGSADRCAKVWTAEDGRCMMFLPHPQPVTSVAFHPTERLLGTSCGDGVVRVFRVGGDDEKAERAALEVPAGDGIAIGMAFGGDSIYTATWGGMLGVFDYQGTHVTSISATATAGASVTSLAADFGSPLVCCTDSDGQLRLFDLRAPSHARIECVTAHADACVSAQFCDGGKTVVSIGFDKVVKVWDAKMLKAPKATFKVAYPSKLAVSANGKFLVQLEDKSFCITDTLGMKHGKLKTSADAFQREHLRLQVCSCFSADESVLYTSGFDRHVVAWFEERDR